MKRKNQKPLMSIVVLNWNGLEDTKVCLEHLRKLDYPDYEVIIVDNGSHDGSKDFLAKQKDIIYVDNPTNRGFTGGHIDGLEHCSGEYIVLLNNDAVMQHNYLTKALENFDDPKVAAVGGRSYFWNDDQPILDESNQFYAYQTVNYVTGEAFMASSDFGVKQVVNNVSGSAVVVRRSVIEECGYLYDRFFAYFEETDLFARYKRAGYTVLYDPRLHIWHRNGASSGASSGSHFFYYQIFRNRFFFAMRNFESAYLRRFLRTYTRIALGSMARFLLRPHSPNRVMYKAYSQAALHNALTFGKELAGRRQLRKKLGKSTYNHILFVEQTGVSIVYDATVLNDKQRVALEKQLAADTNPLHEYVLVVTGQHHADFKADQPNLRYVVDRGFFPVNPLNLGCLAARFDWVVLGDTAAILPTRQLVAGMSLGIQPGTEVIALGNSTAIHPALLIRKSLYQRMGGLPAGSRAELVNAIIDYARRRRSIAWHAVEDTLTTLKLRTTPLSQTQEHALSQKIQFDTAIAENGDISAWGKFKNKHYRIYQFTMLFHWLVIPQVSLYLKAARLKNLLLFTLTLRRKALALELKHIRNEVIINTTPGDLARQKKVTKERLEILQKNPADIPVFIICRDRVDDLKVLVAWLEKHNLRNIVFIDNDSIYPPLVEYLNTTTYQVLKLYRNVGHTSPWTLQIIRALVPEDFYIVSDPDVLPVDECPDDVIKHFLELHKRHFMYLKVGFGLRIDNLPDHYSLKQQVIDWEQQFWTNELEEGAFEAGVDTTFALYKPFAYNYCLHPSIRTGFPYVAHHAPWYLDSTKISAEEVHYRLRADGNVTSWNTDTIADRYAKEMKRKKKK